MKGSWYIRGEAPNDVETIAVEDDGSGVEDPLVFEESHGLRFQYDDGTMWFFPWSHIVRVVFSPSPSDQ